MWSDREIINYGRDLLGSWKKKQAEALSCFDTERLFERMQAFTDLECGQEVLQEMRDASNQNRDADAVAAVWWRVYNTAFVTLLERGLLEHLMVVEEIPTAAALQINAMSDAVAAYNHVEEVAEVVAPVVPIDPVALCVKEFHEMGSDKFKQKYLNNTRNRPIYEACIDRGLL